MSISSCNSGCLQHVKLRQPLRSGVILFRNSLLFVFTWDTSRHLVAFVQSRNQAAVA